MTRDDHRSPGRLAPPRPDHRWGLGASSVPSRRPAPERRAEPPADYWEPAPQEDPYAAPEATDSYGYGSSEAYPPRPPAPLYPGERRAAARVFPASEQVSDDPRAADYGYAPAGRAQASAGYFDQPLSSPRQAIYDPEPEADMLTMQERYILLMRTIELHDDVWRLASIRSNEAKERLEAYLIPRNKRMELKEAIHRNLFMVITIDRLGNTMIKEPRREGPLRRMLRWLFGGD
jgi:hypothetical protein